MTMNARWDEDDLREDAFNQLRLDVRVAEAPLIALVADLAKTLCTTIAALTLLTRDTVYLYAAHGLTQRQLPRAYALCNQTVRQVGVTAFNDLHAVPGLAGHPLLRQIPKLRFYAGAPLVAPNGAAVGAICVLDERPRILDDDQCHILLLAAATIGSRWLLHGLEQRAELESPKHRAEKPCLASKSKRPQNKTRTTLSAWRWQSRLQRNDTICNTCASPHTFML